MDEVTKKGAPHRPCWPKRVAARSRRYREATAIRADGVVVPIEGLLNNQPGASRHPSWPGRYASSL